MVAAMAAVTMPVAAQETYQDTKLIGNDLNGTARYVGMGGAMEALGADISTISSNPAGLALFRKGQVTLSAGVVSQAEADTKPSFGGISAYINGDKTNLSLIRWVWYGHCDLDEIRISTLASTTTRAVILTRYSMRPEILAMRRKTNFRLSSMQLEWETWLGMR